MTEMKTTINQIKLTVYHIISRQDQTGERIPEMKDRIREVLQTVTGKTK
jgi:hypothetical protein